MQYKREIHALAITTANYVVFSGLDGWGSVVPWVDRDLVIKKSEKGCGD